MRSNLRLLYLAVIVALVATACGDAAEAPTPATEAPTATTV